MTRKRTKFILTIVVVFIGLLSLYSIWEFYLYSPWTRDGRIRAHVVTIAPDVSGFIVSLDVKDNQFINKGDILLKIDRSRYGPELESAKAKAIQAKVALEKSVEEYSRRQKLIANKSISKEELANYKIATELKEAEYKEALANQKIAQVNFDRTTIYAPVSGYITNTNIRQGNYAKKSVTLLSIVESDSFYVTGYFEETKIPKIKIEAPAKITLMSGIVLRGKVESIGRGVADKNTTVNSLSLPEIQQTYDWIRLAKRIPVNIKLTYIPNNVVLSAGMNSTISIE
ncbi:efflux RND transporter periplasmic adaptor subunit [Francisella philomiragia]|uniref:efflux RND transporter periplasmic adaptor subunit n=1 Tax=Francisella philomiragia TaxID=28110 RepID=UPI001905E781|nr:HlyD family secretion protein [Francisella philomiragia]MBK2025180.1 HlyD family secretion protein [Francisella philomiragia]